MVSVHSSCGTVWGVSTGGQLWYRAGVEAASPMGTNWFLLNTGDSHHSPTVTVLCPGPTENVEWKYVAGFGGNLWGLDKEDQLLCRQNNKIFVLKFEICSFCRQNVSLDNIERKQNIWVLGQVVIMLM